MNAEIKKTDATVEVVIEGRVDTTTAPRLEKIIREQMEDCQELILNMEKMDYMSSAGLRVLLVTQKQMQKQGSMVLRQVGEPVMEVLEMTGFSDILTIE